MTTISFHHQFSFVGQCETHAVILAVATGFSIPDWLVTFIVHDQVAVLLEKDAEAILLPCLRCPDGFPRAPIDHKVAVSLEAGE